MITDVNLVIFGGTGDLSRRKLIPALFAGFIHGLVSEKSRIFLTSRSPLDGTLEDWVREVLAENPPQCDICDDDIARFIAAVSLMVLDLGGASAAWEELSSALLADPDMPVVHFLAIPPKMFTAACTLLGQYKLNGDNARVVLEKPLGHDYASAEAINADVAKTFDESQIFRIDHYLGKEAVQNLLALRFSNRLFEELWSNRAIDHIQITIAEDLGVAGRGAFYEGTGALRDMIQNHVLQLLCLVAMEPPAMLDASSIREEKLKVLKSLEDMDDYAIDQNVVRGQYASGAIEGKAVDDYATDLGLDGESPTETFVAIKTHINNWRWAGVPFYLRTGKRLPARFAEIVIQFKTIPHSPHPAWTAGLEPNRFIIRLQPEDHLAMRLMVKDHGSRDDRLREVELNLDTLAGVGGIRQGPYLRLILDAANGDQSLFVHRAEVAQAWRWVDRIIARWTSDGKAPHAYPSGTWGPYEAQALVQRDGRTWYETHLMKKRG